MKKVVCAILLSGMCTVYSDHLETSFEEHACEGIATQTTSASFGSYVGGGLKTVFKDALAINLNLFSLDSVKVLVATTPFYIGSRFIDQRIQKRFYDPSRHKNINQMPSTFCKVIEKGAFGMVLGLSSLAIFGRTEHARVTGRVYGLGAISALLGKKLVKEFKFEGGKRPWHEKFSCERRADGGFPSGHMVEAAYTATVFGWQYGYKAAIPLGMYAGVMFGVSINRNRHYVSQVVAGTAVGIIYGIAASRVIDCHMKDIRLQLTTSECGRTEFAMSYHF